MSGFAERLTAKRGDLRRAGADALQKRVYAALYGHVRSQVASCRTTIDQLSPQKRSAVVGAYGEAEAWRWCATDDLQDLVDVLDEMLRRVGEEVTLEATPAPAQPDLPMELDPPKPTRGDAL